jgi:hypothetical protein
VGKPEVPLLRDVYTLRAIPLLVLIPRTKGFSTRLLTNMSLQGAIIVPSIVQSCIAVALVVGFVLVRYYLASRRPKNFPPGPPTVPFLGNLTQVPPSKAFLK